MKIPQITYDKVLIFVFKCYSPWLRLRLIRILAGHETRSGVTELFVLPTSDLAFLEVPSSHFRGTRSGLGLLLFEFREARLSLVSCPPRHVLVQCRNNTKFYQIFFIFFLSQRLLASLIDSNL